MRAADSGSALSVSHSASGRPRLNSNSANGGKASTSPTPSTRGTGNSADADKFDSLAKIADLRRIYGLDLDASHAHRLRER